ncbi:putative Nitrate regulatory gene2 protein [Cocos nucifera]|uniref:Putative Nitrate regulatory gene2 protein n=1 Tax=Cocos nucifera TaxID=13894 RepID=A0A8K0N6I6_COCNU|nr:putative Nitrate regulatory gene2 protein [Cocos nucifera]
MVVVPRSRKDLSEIVKELDEYFLKAADAGSRVSVLLEAPNCELPSSKMCSYGKSLNPFLWAWGSNSKTSGFTKGVGDGGGVGIGSMSHSSTVEKLYAWEKKLFLEVKNSQRLKEEHERRVDLLRKQEAKGVDYVKVEKNRKEIDRLESKMLVSSQAIQTTTSEIVRLRESELFPQLLELVIGLMGMWRSMYECHQVQSHIVQQLEYLNNAPSTNPTTDTHQQASLQLEVEVNHWYSAFCSLVKSQREYIYALTGWLRLSLFQCDHNMLGKSQQSSDMIYSLCEEWQLALDRIPDKVASEGIKSFITVIHAIVVQQAEEQKQKRKSELAFKELKKRAEELRSLESKYGPCSVAEGSGEMAWRYPVMEKRAKVEALKTKAEEEKSRYEKSVVVTRAMTLNNLQTGLPNVFQAKTGFASICMQAFESVYNHQRSSDRVIDVKKLLA